MAGMHKETEDVVPQGEGQGRLPQCSLKREFILTRVLPADIDPHRAQLIGLVGDKWTNGITLHYYFFTSPQHWTGGTEQHDAVRNAFMTWKNIPIGLSFKEVFSPEEAEIRIGFQRGAGSWSYVGNYNTVVPKAKRTMNFGWDLTTPYGKSTALHEIGHALGFLHEHQSPYAGIVFNEKAVYEYFRDVWTPEQIKFNILDKLPPNDLVGSSWDPKSIMHYYFEAGLIDWPDKYKTEGLPPNYTLSQADKDVVRFFYRDFAKEDFPPLRPFESAKFRADAGKQVDYKIEPTESRKYTIKTFGDQLDVLMALYQNVADGEPLLVEEDDDLGAERNAEINVRLHRGASYTLRVRVASSKGEGAVMVW